MGTIKPIKRKSEMIPYFMHVIDMNYLPNAHREVEVVIILEGELEITIDGQAQTCYPGDVIFVNEFAVHAYTTKVTSVLLGCTFRKECSREIERFVDQQHDQSFIFRNEADIKKIVDFGHWINRTKEQATDIQRLAYLFFLFGYVDDSKCRYFPKNRNQLIVDVLQYIDENLDRELELDDICNDLAVSKYYLSHQFKENIGISLISYITKLRLAGAKRVLIESNQKIAEIAEHLGFGSVRTFNRLFVTNFGISPTEFRELNRKNDYLEISSALGKK